MSYDYNYEEDDDIEIYADINLEEGNVPEIFKDKFSYFGTCKKTPNGKFVRIVCNLEGKWGCFEDGKDFLFPCKYSTIEDAEDALEHYMQEANKLMTADIL